MDSYADCIFDDWVAVVPESVSINVNTPILKLAANEELAVNFSTELNELMQEASHIKTLVKSPLPENLLSITEKDDSIWIVRARLCDICDDYNEFKKITNINELQLLRTKVDTIEEMIDECCTISTWSTFEVDFVQEIYQAMRSLQQQTVTIQNNISSVLKGIEKWGENPFYDRKDKDPRSLLDLEDRPNILKARRMECEGSRRQLTNAIEKNKQLFQVDFSDEGSSELFQDYLKYIDYSVLGSLKLAVYQNLLFLRHEMFRNGIEPLIEIRAMAKNGEVAFSPSLEQPLDMLSEKSETFIGKIEMVINDICSMAETIPRVRADKEKTSFMIELREDEDIQDVKHEVRMAVLKGISDVRSYVKRFDKYKFLWTSDREKILNHMNQEPKIDEFRENVRPHST